LEVEFETGGVYQYFEVPPDVHRNLLAAESLGRYFVEQVRDSYRYARMSG
jgi:hypothetical protein